jgi:hypothetical protein
MTARVQLAGGLIDWQRLEAFAGLGGKATAIAT